MVSPSHTIGLVQSSDLSSTDRQHRATWVSTELMLTFPTPVIKSITIIPQNTEETGGRFRVWLFLAEQQPKLIWDRKVEGGFPELKALVRRPIIKCNRPLIVTNRNSAYEKFVFEYARAEDQIRKLWLELQQEQQALLVRILCARVSPTSYDLWNRRQQRKGTGLLWNTKQSASKDK